MSGSTRVSRYQKGKTKKALEQEIVSGSGICWAICKFAPHADNHANIPPLSFLQAGCPSWRPTNSDAVEWCSDSEIKMFTSTLDSAIKQPLNLRHWLHTNVHCIHSSTSHNQHLDNWNDPLISSLLMCILCDVRKPLQYLHHHGQSLQQIFSLPGYVSRQSENRNRQTDKQANKEMNVMHYVMCSIRRWCLRFELHARPCHAL